MGTVWSWVLSALIAVLIVGMVAYARGQEHHRGDDVGAVRAPAAGVVTMPAS
jgi:hypothetical protein